jgi:hypothetical protein
MLNTGRSIGERKANIKGGGCGCLKCSIDLTRKVLSDRHGRGDPRPPDGECRVSIYKEHFRDRRGKQTANTLPRHPVVESSRILFASSPIWGMTDKS